MLVKLLLAFILIPLVELFLLVWIAGKTSLLATVALVIVTGVIGSLLARQQGLQAWYRFRRATSEGRLPGREIQDGLLIAFAAALLLTPGLLTDVVGFALLVPATRGYVRRRLMQRLAGRFRLHVMASGSPLDSSLDDQRYGAASPSSRSSRSDTVDAVNVRTLPPESKL